MTAWCDEILREVYGGRRWLVAADVLGACEVRARRLRGWGAEPCFLLGGRHGKGEDPDPDVGTWRVLGLPEADMMEGIRDAERAFRALPDAVLRDIDAWDPERRARSLGLFYSTGEPIGGRPFFGARPAAWQRLEDKTVVDALWDAAGVPRAPSAVVELDRGALAGAAGRLDQGQGTIWVGDNREGFHGAASYLRWVRGPAEAEEALAFLATRCDRARVMPFLDGIPCSVHGVVFPDHVLVLRPAEMIVLRTPSSQLQYMSAATFWDPPPGRREEMRAVARRVGEHLRDTVDYRGAFTVDGVMTATGFLPTELNPRPGAALGHMGDGFPFEFVHYALIERVDADWRPRELEAQLLAASDAVRRARFGILVPNRRDHTESFALVWEGDGWRRAREGEPPHARGTVGPGVTGGYLGLVLEGAHTPVGPSVAPRAAAFARWAVDELGVTLPPLEPAPDLR